MAANSTEVYESLITELSCLDREALITRLMCFDGNLQLDFSETFLNDCSTEHIRHLLLAALWRCRMKQVA